MHKAKPLFITYKTDLGGASLGKLYEDILKEDFDFFELNMIEIDAIQGSLKRFTSYLSQILLLRKFVKSNLKNGQKVVFQNVKPALFCFGLWNSRNGILISDFSHTLFNWYKSKKIKKNARYYFQILLYRKFHKILALTTNLKSNIEEIYKIDGSKIIYIPLPLDFNEYHQKPQHINKLPKVLFVGGEFYRKGGDVVLDAWDIELKGICELVIVTNTSLPPKEGVTILKNVKKGTSKHKELFQQSDIFILPTDRDAYPIVLGEAAVCSLAIITTQFAFGAKDIIVDKVSGIVATSAKACVEELIRLLKNPELIFQYKENTYMHIQNNFSNENFKASILKSIQ
jgi:glycosyltransferase involved in cell wall biosynthesis